MSGVPRVIFFFQAEDGIRDLTVTGVQTCALPISNLVESVEINKTLSANQDGDAIGGSVNLVTKTAEEKPTVYINGIGGYTPIIGGGGRGEGGGGGRGEIWGGAVIYKKKKQMRKEM